MNAPHVVVIGGGLSGLMAAHRLRAIGVGVTLLEASGRPGGQMRTRQQGEWTIEAGGAAMPAATGVVDDLLRLAGLEDSRRIPLSDARRRRFLVHDGRPVAVPTTTSEMVASPLLSIPGRLRLLKEPFVARGEPDPEESVLSFATRRFGAEMAARFIDPVVSAVSGGDPATLLASQALPHLVALERRAGSILKGRMRAARRARQEGRRSDPQPPWSCAGGMEEVPRALAEMLGASMRLEEPVTSLRRTSSGWSVESATGRRFEGDGVLLALPAIALRSLELPGEGGDALHALSAMPHASVATVSLGFHRDQVAHPLDGHGVLTSMADRSPLRSVVFASSLLPDRAPSGHVLLTATVGGVHHPDLVTRGDADLIALVTELLAGLLDISGSPVLSAVDRWPEALPQAVAGHGAAIGQVAAFEGTMPSVSCCGAWRDGLTFADAMRGGVAAAERLAERLGAWHAPAAEAS